MSRPDDFLLTDEELRLRKRRRVRRGVIIGSIVATLIGGYIAGRPTLNAIKSWQARRHARTALAFIEQENWAAARTEAVTAFQLRPSEPEALRAIARFLSRIRQPEALEFWKRLRENGQLSPTDRRDEATIALLAGDLPRAERALQEATASNPAPADWLLAAQLALQKRAPAAAQGAAAKVFENTAATDREQLQAALLELSAAALAGASAESETRMREAWSRVEKIGATPTAAGL
ncbi:MAG: tetratricopeptide repeat protein, partial [Chthoniobacterales bacterium]